MYDDDEGSHLHMKQAWFPEGIQKQKEVRFFLLFGF